MTYEFPTSRLTFVWRGITNACPRCGSRKTHKNYFSIRPNCLCCSLKFEKEQGYWTGSLATNMILTGGLVVVSLIVGLVLTAPDIPAGFLMALILPIAIITPIFIHPITHTVWMAIDYGFMSRLDN